MRPNRIKFKNIVSSAITIIFALFMNGASLAQSNSATTESPADVCGCQAPWKNGDRSDNRSWMVEEESDRIAPHLLSNNPSANITGHWLFKLKDIPDGTAVANKGRLVIYQQGEGYESTEGVLGWVKSKDDAKFMAAGERWGHKNYGRLITPEEPEEIPPGYLNITNANSFQFVRPQYYPFPEITARIGSDKNRMVGQWRIDLDGETQTGVAEFTRVIPKIASVKFKSTIEDHVETSGNSSTLPRNGCVVLDYSGNWGADNNMRGNRPGFHIELFADDLKTFDLQYYKIWIDPKHRLEIDSGYPKAIYEKDENGKLTTKVIGLSVRLNIWSGTRWGPKTIFFEGQQIGFDYVVNPVYDFKINPTRFRLVDGHFPEKPEAGQATNLGFRLINIPDHPQNNTVVEFTFTDDNTGGPVRDIKFENENFSLIGEGRVLCKFATIGWGKFEEFEFEMPMPRGGLNWVAMWNEDGRKYKAMRTGVIAADLSPQITRTFCLSDQTGSFRPQTKMFSFPYPRSGPVKQVREVIVFGHNLPQKFTDDCNIESLNSSIQYTPRFGPVYSDRTEQAWSDFGLLLKKSPEQLKKSFQVLLLEARINGSVLPSEQAFKLNGKIASWDLRFGGLQAAIEFVREVAHPNGRGGFTEESLQTAYAPEKIFVRITTSAPLPLDTIPVIIHAQQAQLDPLQRRIGNTEGQTLTTHNLQATKTAPGVYKTKPILLVDKGNPRFSPQPLNNELAINIFLLRRGADQLVAEIDPEFASKSFVMPIGPQAPSLLISRSPSRHRTANSPFLETDYQFKTYLRKASLVKATKKTILITPLIWLPITWVDSQKLQKLHEADWDSLAETEYREFANTLFLTLGDHRHATKITLGHYAAMLMMRDMFIEIMNEQIAVHDSILQQGELGLLGYLKKMRLELFNNNLAINRIKVVSPNGGRVEFGTVVLIEDTKHLARRFQKTPSEISRWRQMATAEAITRLTGNASEAAAHARAIDDGDIEGLLKLTGSGFETVINRLKPRLMKLIVQGRGNESRMFWVPDAQARKSIAETVHVCDQLARQREANDKDNLHIQIVLGVASIPAMILGSPAVALVAGYMDLGMLGNDTVKEWQKVYASSVEIDFSRNAAVAIGFSRHAEAEKKATRWLSAYGKTLLHAGFAGLSIHGILSARESINVLRAQDLMRKGRDAIEHMPSGGLRRLSLAERKNAELFAYGSKIKEFRQGRAALNEIERKAIQAVEDEANALRRAAASADQPRVVGVSDPITLPPGYAQNVGQIKFTPYVHARTQLERPALKLVPAGRAPDHPVVPLPSRPRPSTPTTSSTDNLLTDAQLEHQLARSLDNGFGSLSRGKVLANQKLQITPEGMSHSVPVKVSLGDVVGEGSFSTALRNKDAYPWAKFDTLTTIEFRGSVHILADKYGKDAIELVVAPGSRAIATPRSICRWNIPEDAIGAQRYIQSVNVVEDFGESAGKLFAGKKIEGVHVNLIKDGIADINKSGYVWLDIKLNQFGFPNPNKNGLRMGIWDFGGVVKVKGNAATRAVRAKEIQNAVCERWQKVRDWLIKNKGTKYAIDEDYLKPNELLEARARKEYIMSRFEHSFADVDKLGFTNIRHFEFNPAFARGLQNYEAGGSKAAKELLDHFNPPTASGNVR